MRNKEGRWINDKNMKRRRILRRREKSSSFHERNEDKLTDRRGGSCLCVLSLRQEDKNRAKEA
jgi:hypothetical protein